VLLNVRLDGFASVELSVWQVAGMDGWVTARGSPTDGATAPEAEGSA
jgi:hypothetical protein